MQLPSAATLRAARSYRQCCLFIKGKESRGCRIKQAFYSLAGMLSPRQGGWKKSFPCPYSEAHRR